MTAKAELLTQSPNGRRGAERRLQGDVSAACNSVVLAAASDRHKNYSALRGYPWREKKSCRSSLNRGYRNQKSALHFLKNIAVTASMCVGGNDVLDTPQTIDASTHIVTLKHCRSSADKLGRNLHLQYRQRYRC